MVDSQQTSGLRERIQKAGLWTIAVHVTESGVRLATSLVMTRLLLPQDFGLMAVAITIPVGLGMLSDIGIRSNVIRKSGVLGTDFLTTAWTVQVLRGVLLWGFTLLLAGILYLPHVRRAIPAESILSHPQLPLLVAAMGSILAISGFESVNIYVQERDIQFKPLALRSIISKIIPVPIMVTWGYLYPSVWSLVAGALVAQAILIVSSHISIRGPSMRFTWQRDHAKNLLGDGRWITLSTAGTFLVTQGDRLILAALLTATQMGLYAIAWTLIDVVRSFLLRFHAQITLPVLSELFRTRPASAIEAYYKYRAPIDALTFTTVGLLWIAAPEIVVFLFDKRYEEAGWILQVLALSIASFPYLMINLAFIANDEWRSFAINSAIMTCSFFISVLIGYFLYGWTGVIWGIALYSWPAALILLARAHRRGWVVPIREIAMLPFALVGIGFGFAAKWILQWIGTVL
ncbi:MAG TPA: oligosaccharide flippase family protein [Aestuariivirga sp.]|nr:oligosaccharide flippase family protein [Aestuariivirga sp.]